MFYTACALSQDLNILCMTMGGETSRRVTAFITMVVVTLDDSQHHMLPAVLVDVARCKAVFGADGVHGCRLSLNDGASPTTARPST